MATGTIQCPGCGQNIMQGAAVECNFKPSSEAATRQKAFDVPQERHWLCMECKYIVENRYRDSVQTEDLWIFFPILELSLGRINFSLAMDSTPTCSSFP